jgi:hypothetical protein
VVSTLPLVLDVVEEIGLGHGLKKVMVAGGGVGSAKRAGMRFNI